MTYKHGILVVEINFQAETFVVNKLKTFKTKNGVIESFNKSSELRDICASGQNLYVVERANRIICLKYVNDEMGGQLHHVAENHCSPYAIGSDGDKVYCSRNDERGEFYIAEATESNGKLDVNNLFKA